MYYSSYYSELARKLGSSTITLFGVSLFKIVAFFPDEEILDFLPGLEFLFDSKSGLNSSVFNYYLKNKRALALVWEWWPDYLPEFSKISLISSVSFY